MTDYLQHTIDRLNYLKSEYSIHDYNIVTDQNGNITELLIRPIVPMKYINLECIIIKSNFTCLTPEENNAIFGNIEELYEN